MSLVPLSAYGKPYTPPNRNVDPSVDMKTPVREQVHALSAVDYFKLLAQFLKTNPPAADDSAIVSKMARLGIVPSGIANPAQLELSLSDFFQFLFPGPSHFIRRDHGTKNFQGGDLNDLVMYAFCGSTSFSGNFN
jgi:hypothetical protein